MNFFHIVWMVIIGLVVGILARLILPGAQHISLLMTALFGIGGSVIGGLIGMAIKKPAPDEKFHPAGMLLSVIGTVLLMFIAQKLFPNM